MLVGKNAGQPGDWLRQELTRRGYDLRYGGQSQFARDADMHVSIINRALKGTPVSLDVLRRMGRPLGYSLGDMLVLSGTATRDELPARPREALEDAPEPELDDSPFIDPHERQIWAWDDLPESARRQVIIALRSVIKFQEEEDRRPDADVHPIRRRHDAG